MMDAVTLATLQFIILHTLDGRSVYVNVEQVVSMVEQKGKESFIGGVNCVVNLTDQRFITVMENCESVRLRLDNLKK